MLGFHLIQTQVVAVSVLLEILVCEISSVLILETLVVSETLADVSVPEFLLIQPQVVALAV